MGDVYYNGKFVNKNKLFISADNRGLKYGDSFFETIRCVSGFPLFWEEHYFRIAGSFYVLKMKIPIDFEIDKMKSIINKLLIRNNLHLTCARIRITFFRGDGGYYFPKKNNVQFFVLSNIQ